MGPGAAVCDACFFSERGAPRAEERKTKGTGGIAAEDEADGSGRLALRAELRQLCKLAWCGRSPPHAAPSSPRALLQRPSRCTQ